MVGYDSAYVMHSSARSLRSRGNSRYVAEPAKRVDLREIPEVSNVVAFSKERDIEIEYTGRIFDINIEYFSSGDKKVLCNASLEKSVIDRHIIFAPGENHVRISSINKAINGSEGNRVLFVATNERILKDAISPNIALPVNAGIHSSRDEPLRYAANPAIDYRQRLLEVASHKFEIRSFELLKNLVMEMVTLGRYKKPFDYNPVLVENFNKELLDKIFNPLEQRVLKEFRE